MNFILLTQPRTRRHRGNKVQARFVWYHGGRCRVRTARLRVQAPPFRVQADVVRQRFDTDVAPVHLRSVPVQLPFSSRWALLGSRSGAVWSIRFPFSSHWALLGSRLGAVWFQFL